MKLLVIVITAILGFGIGILVSLIKITIDSLFKKNILKRDPTLFIIFLFFVIAISITKILLFSIMFSVFTGIGFVMSILLIDPSQKNE